MYKFKSFVSLLSGHASYFIEYTIFLDVFIASNYKNSTYETPERTKKDSLILTAFLYYNLSQQMHATVLRL